MGFAKQQFVSVRAVVALAASVALLGLAGAARAEAAPSFVRSSPPPPSFATGEGARSVTSADFDGDGAADLAVANRDSNDVSVLLGDGTGGFGAKTDFALADGASPRSITSADFDGDGAPDLAVENCWSNDVSVLVGDGTGGFGAKTDDTGG